MNPFDYSLCRMTVTLYRNGADGVQRQILENCHLRATQATDTDAAGKSRLKPFLLIIPGEAEVLPGDRAYDGIGPDTVRWEDFLPVLIPRLYEVSFVTPVLWDGTLCHIQAGHKEGL